LGLSNHRKKCEDAQEGTEEGLGLAEKDLGHQTFFEENLKVKKSKNLGGWGKTRKKTSSITIYYLGKGESKENILPACISMKGGEMTGEKKTPWEKVKT